MFGKLNYVQKNKLLPPTIVLLFALCWFLSFNKTYNAIEIHSRFNNGNYSNNALEGISFNPTYSKRKLQSLDKTLRNYNVNSDQWSNDVWLTVSSLALSKKVKIDFTTTQPVPEIDSTSVGVKQSFLFFGNYIQLVKLIDTLEHTPRIGQISEVKIRIQKEAIDSGSLHSCIMQITLQGLAINPKF